MRNWLIRKLGGVSLDDHIDMCLRYDKILKQKNKRLHDLHENTPKRDPKTGRFVRRDG